MLIQPHKWEYISNPGRGTYTVKLTVDMSYEQMISANDALYVFVRGKNEGCDAVCPTCGGSLSC